MATENMNTFLFPWSDWVWDEFDCIIEKLKTGLTHDEEWVSHRKKNIRIGDKVFLIRLGKKISPSEKGIVGIGTICSFPYDGIHPLTGKTTNKVKIRFSTLSQHPIFTLDELKLYDITQRWDIEAGGTIVKNPDIASELYNAIASLYDTELDLDAILDSKIESESKLKEKLKEIEDPVRLGLAKYRIGQDKFRKSLLNKWKNKCSVTNIKYKELLVASHIKPWSVSTTAEKLDEFNGLLLSAHLDALFDKGFISFDDDGQIIISPKVEAEKKVFGIDNDMRFSIENDHKKYLKYHRENIFRK